jgi:hypothetical protein
LVGPQIATTTGSAIYAFSAATGQNVLSKGVFVPTPPAPAPPPPFDAGASGDAGTDAAFDASSGAVDAGDAGDAGDVLHQPLDVHGSIDGLLGDSFLIEVWDYAGTGCNASNLAASKRFRSVNVPQTYAVTFPPPTAPDICHREFRVLVQGGTSSCGAPITSSSTSADVTCNWP